MNKWPYDLSHYAMSTGEIGRLQTLSVIPLVAGDVLQGRLQGVCRLSPLRRQLMVDARVDLFAFYIPHRHIYGSSWVDFLSDGVDETVVFSTGTLTGGLAWPYSYLATKYRTTGATVPLWLLAGYNRIWNRYFRHPSMDSDEKADTYEPANQAEARYGYGIGFLPAVWNTGIEGEVGTADYQVATTGDILDITALAQKQARLKTERRKEFYDRRYTDVLRGTYGTTVNIDADERPQLVMHKSQWMSGYDVDGTDDASLGTYVGKAAATVGLEVPRRQFAEHGALWLMAAVRFPPIHEDEVHYLASKPQPTYKEIAGDPDILAKEPPETLDLDPYFLQGAGHSLADGGIVPYGQWYRYQPSFVHDDYDVVGNFSWLDRNLTSKANTRYHQLNDYDAVFQTTQLAHWQIQSRVDMDVRRSVPPVEASIFAGSV